MRNVDNDLAINVRALDTFQNLVTTESRNAVLTATGSLDGAVFKDKTTGTSNIKFTAGIARLTISVTQVQSVSLALTATDGTSLAATQSFSVAAG
jgi:membrane-bound inhibitor of C-type lysozyme